MHAREVYTWGGKRCPVKEVSSVQECPHREKFHCNAIIYVHFSLARRLVIQCIIIMAQKAAIAIDQAPR